MFQHLLYFVTLVHKHKVLRPSQLDGLGYLWVHIFYVGMQVRIALVNLVLTLIHDFLDEAFGLDHSLKHLISCLMSCCKVDTHIIRK